ncbi:uncharacterized protein LOC127277338 [Leptopilina boulardi]|uniref:uncharacterized protein LOC127277338 n=1 Tax=Leptopilina boulardi TaxID=63433 RepID=UPI0021F52BF3|nr:uncharacterized protein LOC127277338 [Leptopilina boulardi]
MSKKFKTQCIVPNCNSGKLVKLNRFPKNSKQCQLWINAVKNPFLETLSLKEIQTYRVCQLHFSKDSFFITAQRPRLKWDAIPSLHLPFEKIEELKIDLKIGVKNNLNHGIKRKFIDNSISLSYENEYENQEVMDNQDTFWKNDLFEEINNKNQVENILSYASKEFQRAEKSKEITMALKIRAKVYKNGKQHLENEKLKKNKIPFKENREIKTGCCVVPNCNSGRRITKHRFPKDKYVGKKWMKAVKSPFLKEMTYEYIRKKRLAVCYLHFTDDSWYHGMKPRLKPDAIPSLQLPEKLIRKEDMKPKKPIDLPENVNEVPNIKMDIISATSILSYNSMPKIWDISLENNSNFIRESSFELLKNLENLNVKYRSINDIGMIPFDTKYSKEIEI